MNDSWEQEIFESQVLKNPWVLKFVNISDSSPPGNFVWELSCVSPGLLKTNIALLKPLVSWDQLIGQSWSKHDLVRLFHEACTIEALMVGQWDEDESFMLDFVWKWDF